MAGVGLGRLLLALDATMVRLIEAPRGLDLPVASAALIDADDARLGLAISAGAADIFFLLGIPDPDALHWFDGQVRTRAPAAIFVKEPSATVIDRATEAGTAVVAVEPAARWERVYRLVNYVLEHHGDRADPLHDPSTDLFGLAQSIADRTRGMVSIEDAESHVLAYSASSDEADELRRLSILGRAGPPEHLQWLSRWGIFDALRAGPAVVRVAERPELGLRPRLAAGIHRDGQDRHSPGFAGTIWLQQGSQPLADDAEEVLRGGAVLAARILARLAAIPSAHAVLVAEALGLSDGARDVGELARELGVPVDGKPTVIGFTGDYPDPAHLADVLALSATAFRSDAQVIAHGSRVYVLFARPGRASVPSWVRGTIAALRTQLGVDLQAVIASAPGGMTAAAEARAEVDRVLDSAGRHPGTLAAVTSLAEARTTVLLDEILTGIGADDRLIDPRVRTLRAEEPALAHTLSVFLDRFGDVTATAEDLHVHPNTVRYRVRRAEAVLEISLSDPDARLLLALSLRATA
ncbi:helix-turn-helix domain-containing protein [Mycobacterium sp. AMU20-3851]|uniref:PucR family transcriptional regulator n=1 Tax=Mycobacterium sp. AMU20-3851 TaxID=3122055 RepID=UPI0037549B1D